MGTSSLFVRLFSSSIPQREEENPLLEHFLFGYQYVSYGSLDVMTTDPTSTSTGSEGYSGSPYWRVLM
jgi:hypothetical protein